MSYKLVAYIPENHLETVKKALFLAGAGKQGDYDQCCWQVRGEGQFRPLAGSNPHLGSQDELERVPEWRIEILVDDETAGSVKQALLDSHPYEEPAYDFFQRADI